MSTVLKFDIGNCVVASMPKTVAVAVTVAVVKVMQQERDLLSAKYRRAYFQIKRKNI